MSLTVTDEMLHTRDYVLLHAHDRLIGELASKIRVVGKAFPIPASSGDSSQWPSDRPKSDVGTFALELGTKMLSSFECRRLVP